MSKELRCSFCGKGDDEVRKLVAGPNVFICDDCVEIAADIIEHSGLPRTRSPRNNRTGWRRLWDRFFGSARNALVS